jgi:hypothetical protein
MHLLRTVFFAMLLCCGTGATAQIPGYMGKRLVIDAEIQAFPALFTPTTSGNHLWTTNTGDGTYGLHSRFGLGIGYVLSRHQMVHAHVNYLRSGMDVEMTTLSANGTKQTHDLLNIVSGLTFDLAYSRTKPTKGHIAPLGKQKAYHFYRTMINGNNGLYKNGRLVGNQLFGSIDAKNIIYGIGYSVTYNKVINDQFLLSYGWRINLSSPVAILTDNYQPYNSDGRDYKIANLNAFKNATILKFGSYDIMQFKIGFGLLR